MGLLIDTLQGKQTKHIPIWFMRQAGRYLPEYRKVRETCPDFLSFCYTPEKAAQVTLQPIERFGFDAAILFADILTIPDALGIEVDFVKGEGPKLKKLLPEEKFNKYEEEKIITHLLPVGETVKILSNKLPEKTDLIGFAGAPWTIACYMVNGGGSKDFAAVREIAYMHPRWFNDLIHLITKATIAYLRMQMDKGAQAIQLFDSWAGLLPPKQCEKYCIAANKIIRDALKESHPHIPFIAFPKGLQAMALDFVDEVQPDGLGIDMMMPLKFARDHLQDKVVLQGNLDPLLLASNKRKALDKTEIILRKLGAKPFIFNLGHGIVPHTPIENVQAVVEKVKAFRR